MRHTDLIVPIDLTAHIAVIVPTDQALTEAMHLIPQAATVVMGPTATIIHILQEAIPQAALHILQALPQHLQ